MTTSHASIAASLRPVLMLVTALVATTVVYWPGLAGGFIFDDLPFIVENPAIRDLAGNREAWIRAMFGFPVEHQGRWLGMLSFAVNAWLHGFQPFGFKIVNLAIHLANGVLVWLVVRRLVQLLGTAGDAPWQLHERVTMWLPVVVAALWLVLPINLTAVLYVVQRFESLSNLFILLGMYAYLGWRMRLLQGTATVRSAVFLVGGFALLGATVKESALLLPLYTVVIELVLLQYPAQKRLRLPILKLYAVILGIPLLAGGVWYLGWAGGGSTYPRHFSTIERLLTEFRVLFMYMDWTLFPMPSKLTLFHDDIALSRSLVAPVTTLAAGIGHVLLAGGAIATARRWPLASTGILLYYAGHAMTGTVIPLEIVFEHRNYFPSVGLLLAAAVLLARLMQQMGALRLSAALVSIFFVYYSGITFMRASEWGDPLLHAVAEVERQPGSERAINMYGYELLRISSGQPSSRFHSQAMEAFERCSAVPGSTITCDAALILERERIGVPVADASWERLQDKLRAAIPRFSDVNSLSRLVECYVNRACGNAHEQLDEALRIARGKGRSNQVLLNASARFAYFVRGDSSSAERFLLQAVDRNPEDPSPLVWLATMYLAEGRLEAAGSTLDRADSLPRAAYMQSEIDSVRADVAEHKAAVLENR